MRDQLTLEENDDSIRLRAAWEQVLTRLSREVVSGQFGRFLRPLTPVGLQGGTVIISCPGRFVYEWVSQRFGTTLENQLSDELGFPVRIELRTEVREKPPIPASPAAPVVISSSDEPSFRPNERYSFENFVVGQSNRLAHAGAMAVSQEPGTKYNPLFIYGPSGLGKTHLLHSIARVLQARDPRFQLVYITAQQFAENFVTALQNNRIEQFRRQQRAVGIWLVDDVQFVAGKDKTQEELFHTFNYLQQLDKQIVITSDRPPRDLQLMDERLRSRFEAGLVADVQMPDTETRCAIVLSKAEQERIPLRHDVAMVLAENVPGTIRALEGALTKLVVYSSVENRPLDVELANQLVEQYYRAGGFAKPAFDQIVAAVSQHFKIPPTDICGTSRKAPIVQARHVAVYVTREITGDSWKHIGSLFGDRDHTSMMHGYQKISELMNRDKDLRTQVRTIIRTLHPEARE